MIEVEATREILVRLSFAAMLGDDQSGDRFQQFSRPVDRALIELFLQHGTFVGRVCGPDEIVAFGRHDDWLESRHACGIGLRQLPCRGGDDKQGSDEPESARVFPGSPPSRNAFSFRRWRGRRYWPRKRRLARTPILPRILLMAEKLMGREQVR